MPSTYRVPHGGRPLNIPNFGGGLVLDEDPLTIGDNQAAGAENVDFTKEFMAVRKGKAAYNSSAPAVAAVTGVFPWYPNTGSRSLLLAAGTKIYADLNQDGDFGDAGEEIATGLTGGTFTDFCPYRDKLYIGNGVDTVKRWTGSSTVATAGPPTAPAAAPSITAISTKVDTFEDDGSGWTETGGNAANVALSRVDRDTRKIEGTYSLKIHATGAFAGVGYTKAPSAGSTIDLSKAEELSVWLYATRRGPNIQIGIAKDGEAATDIDYSNFPIINIDEKGKWFEVRIPLTNIPPQSRDAVPFIGIRLVDEGGITVSASKTFSLFVDDMRAVGPFHKDRYYYYYTYAVKSGDVTLRESNPFQNSTNFRYPAKAGDTGTFEVDMPPAVSKLRLTGSYTNATGITHIKIYRYRETGPDRVPRLIDTITNDGTTNPFTYDDAISDATIQMEARPALIHGKMDPPIGATYLVANGRLFVGAPTISATYYPSRVYVSRYGFPEEFGTVQQTDTILPLPTDAGWFDLPEPDPIKRLVEFNGSILIFTDRSVWQLTGSGWTDYDLSKRAKVGLVARWAVAEWDRACYFLSGDGLRIIVPTTLGEGLWDTWVLSEPVESLLRAIPRAYLGVCALGVDERHRLELAIVRSGQTVSDASLVFDRTIQGAQQKKEGWRDRPGWTYYTSRGASCFAKLKEGVTVGSYVDAGQLIAGDPATAKIWYFNRSTADADLTTDSGSAIAWNWTSKAWDAGPGRKFDWHLIAAEFDAAANQTVTATPVLDGTASATTYTLSLGSASSGRVADEERTAASIRGGMSQLKLSGSQSVALKVRSAALAVGSR